jgi:hypothetical protein
MVTNSGSFGLFRGEPRQRQGCQVRAVVDESMGQRYRPRQRGQEPVLAPVEGSQRAKQGSGAAFQAVDGAGAGKVPGRGDHPEREVDASMSVKRLESGAGADHSGAALVTGQLPLSPLVLAAGEACGAVADGGLSTRRGKGGRFPEEISDEGAPQGNSCAAGSDGGGLDGPERTRTIRQDSS